MTAKSSKASNKSNHRRNGQSQPRSKHVEHQDVVTADNEKQMKWWRLGVFAILTISLMIHPKRFQSTMKVKQSAAYHDNSRCGIVMAPSTIENAGWGVFALNNIPERDPVLFGEPVIQLVNVTEDKHAGLYHLLHHYAWYPETTGGQDEGVQVMSVVPGLSMLANSQREGMIISDHPRINHDGLVRGTASAGANTHYHDLSKYAYRTVQAGQEIFLDYGRDWDHKVDQDSYQEAGSSVRPIQQLRETGFCLDHLRSGLSAGKSYGAFATRSLKADTIIAPVPVLAVRRNSLLMEDGRQQLLLNYCYGHPRSSILLFPYGPSVTLLNHDPYNPNARLQWSSNNDPSWFELTTAQVIARHESGLLLELVATRDIEPGEEIFIDYGTEYQNAWDNHNLKFSSVTPRDQGLGKPYSYAFEANLKLRKVLTESEQRDSPYPPNLITSCLHSYQNVKTKTREIDTHTGDVLTYAEFEFDPALFQPENLRPCRVMERRDAADMHDVYTVEILNREHGRTTALVDRDRIPTGERHFVTGMPREALYFSDVVSSTDQHLPSAFRHEIGLPSGLYPSKWMDLDQL